MKNNFTVFFALLICSSLMHASQSDLRKSTSPRPAVLEKKDSTPRLYSVEDKVKQLETTVGKLTEQLNSSKLQDGFVSQALELHASSLVSLQGKVDQALLKLQSIPTATTSHAFTDEALASIEERLKSLQEQMTALTRSTQDSQNFSPLHLPTLVNRVNAQEEKFLTLTNTVHAHQKQLEDLWTEIESLKLQSVTTSNRDVVSATRSEESLHDVSAFGALQKQITAYESRIAALEKINADAHAANRKAQAERKKSVNRARAFFAILAGSGATYYVTTHTQRGQEITSKVMISAKDLWSHASKSVIGLCTGLFASAPVVASVLEAPVESAQPTESELATAPVDVQTTVQPTAE